MPKFKLCSWNVNGIRAVHKKGFFEWLSDSDFDMVGVQETKAQPDQLSGEFKLIDGYPTVDYNSAERKGYSGVGNFFSKKFEPTTIKHGFDIKRFEKAEKLPPRIAEVDEGKKITTIAYDGRDEIIAPDALPENIADLGKYKTLNKKELKEQIDAFNSEGRILESQHDFDGKKMIVLNIYFPNGGQSTERLQFKMEFYEMLLVYLDLLLEETPFVVVTGDYNTAHSDIDLARPKANLNTTGFMPVERMYLDFLEEKGFMDTYRVFNPEKPEMFTWWSFRTAARERNIGWRIDYFFVSEALKPYLTGAEILTKQTGSDHCPISIELST